MANIDNSCSELNIVDKYTEFMSEGKDPMTEMLNTQKYLQEEVYFRKTADHVSYKNTKLSEMTLAQMKDFLLTNEHALVDELHELLDSLGGIHDGIGSGFWKHWKDSHAGIPNMTLKDLTERDLKEAKMEAIDVWHFVMNVFLCLGIDSKDLCNFYFAKNKENIDRKARGY